MCKDSDVFSLTVLIDRGLDLQYSNRCIRTHFDRKRCDARNLQLVLSIILFNVTLFSSQGSIRTRIVGADDGEGTPVPIPNTAVKLTRADNTWLEAAW